MCVCVWFRGHVRVFVSVITMHDVFFTRAVGGQVVRCNGDCRRVCHSRCLGLGREGYPGWVCAACTAHRHACFLCGVTANVGEVERCSEPGCGHFYHRACIVDKPRFKFSGGRFMCAAHTCASCARLERPAVRCVRCPTSWHAGCAPTDMFQITQTTGKGVLCSRHDRAIPEPDVIGKGGVKALVEAAALAVAEEAASGARLATPSPPAVVTEAPAAAVAAAACEAGGGAQAAANGARAKADGAQAAAGGCSDHAAAQCVPGAALPLPLAAHAPSDYDIMCCVCEEEVKRSIVRCVGDCLRVCHPGCIGLDRNGFVGWRCAACAAGRQRCFACGVTGGVGDRGPAGVQKCSHRACGRFYHKRCIEGAARVTVKSGSFTCPLHVCAGCASASPPPNVRCVR